jgi:hypothetical protein
MKEQIECWNGFIASLMEAKAAWENLSEMLKGQSPRIFQSLPLVMQKGIPNPHSSFEIAVTRLIEKQRGYGLLEDFLVPEAEIPIEKELEDGSRSAGSGGSTGRSAANKTKGGR